MLPNNGRLLLGLGAMVAAVWLTGAVPVAAQGNGAGDPARGERLYYDHACYSCHGYNGQTGARDLVGTGSPIVENEELFISFLRLRADHLPLFPSTRMPSYSASALGDAEARDIFAYIRTFELDQPDVADLPALQAILESAARPAGE